MKNKKITVLIIGFMLIAMIPAACGNPAQVTAPSNTDPTNIPPTNPAPTYIPSTPAAAFPTGRLNGNGEALQFNPDGTFEFYTNASKTEPVFVGQYTVDGNLITSINPDESDPKYHAPGH